jgi:uncharacterized protein (TIGR03067 family)
MTLRLHTEAKASEKGTFMFNKLVVLVACVFAVIGFTGCPGTACFGIDGCQLQGTWEASVTVGGTSTVTNRMIITNDTFSYATLTNGFEGTYKINALTNPKQIDFMVTRSYVGIGALQVVNTNPETKLSIYTVSKDTLTVQFGDGANRPGAFDSSEFITMAHISAT